MPLSFVEQFDLASQSWTRGDFDLLSKMLTDPDTVSYEDQRTTAERLGIKGGFLQAITNIVYDPTVWIAMMLSRKFPTSQYLRGAVPSRLVGTASEFSGLSSVGRTVEGFFRGTNIPKLLSLKMQREAEVTQIGNRIFDKLLTRPNWKEEMPIVSNILEGQRPNGATPELYALAGEIRSGMDQMWSFLARTQKVSGGFEASTRGVSFATARPFSAGEAPRYLRDYLPHIPLTGNESTFTISGTEALRRMGQGRMAQAMQAVGENPAAVWTTTQADRLSSEFGRWHGFMERVGAQVFNPRLFRRHRMGVRLQSTEGEGLFITDLNLILQRYIHSVARTYSLNAPLTEAERGMLRTFVTTETGAVKTLQPSSEPIIVQMINEGLAAAGANPATMMRRQVAGTNVFEEFVDASRINRPTLGALRTLIREAKGQADESEALFGSLFNAVRQRVTNTIPGLRERNQIEGAVSAVQQDARGRRATRALTSYFYATTLGLNTASSVKNLMQPFLTTAPSIGIGPTLQGYKVLKARLPTYARSFINEHRALTLNRDIKPLQRINLAQERAFHKTFPELASSGIKADPRAFELSQAEALEEAISGRTMFRTTDEYFKALLQPFTQTELSNQVVTFYGGKAALRNMLSKGELAIPRTPSGRFLSAEEIEGYLNLEASHLVSATQFRPGPGSRTVLQTLIPAPFRMFTSFPVRLANFLADSTVRGSLTAAQIRNGTILDKITGGRNLGTISRVYVLGKAMNEGLRSALGVDMSDALGISGPFTGIVESGRIFSPLTFSPMPSALVGMASFTSTRDLRDLNPLVLPGVGEVPLPKTLVPAGVQISRMSKVLRAFRPDLGGFVDEDERLMYQGDTGDAILALLGIPLEKERRMREALDRMGGNRMRVKQLRRRYTVAMNNYDTGEMSKLAGTFQKEFPGAGTIGVDMMDLQRYQQSARMTAVQRLLQSMGRSMSYLEAPLYEHDPDLIVSPGEIP